jgi:hypothetical protein
LQSFTKPFFVELVFFPIFSPMVHSLVEKSDAGGIDESVKAARQSKTVGQYENTLESPIARGQLLRIFRAFDPRCLIWF